MTRGGGSAPARLLLVRHAETEAAARGRCIGRTDVGLSPEGLRAAEALALRLRLAPPAAVYASTSRRALETARPIASACGAPLTAEPALCEVDFGALEGLAFEEIARRHPGAWREWMERPATIRFPGGEALSDLAARIERALCAIAGNHPGASVAVVSHAGPIRAALARALGLPPARCFDLAVPHLSVHEVEIPPGGSAWAPARKRPAGTAP